MRALIRSGLVALLLLLFVGHAAEWMRIGLLSQFESFAYDTQVRADATGESDRRVVIVDIDENSIARIGQWPWARTELAAMVESLYTRYGVFTVGFDMVFAEPGRGVGHEWMAALRAAGLRDNPLLAEPLQALETGFSGDQRFAEALGKGRSVMGFIFKGALDSPLPIGVLPQTDLAEARTWPAASYRATSYTGNIPILQEGLRGGFFNNPALDQDGVFRRVTLLQQFEGRYYPSLALELLREATGRPEIEVDYGGLVPDPLNIVALNIGGQLRVPVDESLSALVPYRGPGGTFAMVPAADVIDGTADASLLRDAIVLVGTTAPGLKDLRNTPVDVTFPGVEVHANLISGILDGRIKQRVPYRLGILVVQLLIIAALMHLWFPRLPPIGGTLLAAGIGVVLVLTARYAWVGHNFVMPLGLPLAFLAANVLLQVTWSYFIVARARRTISDAFGQYVPPTIVDEIAEDPALMQEAAVSREMTVLFSDVRDFTNISEGLSPEALSQLMNAFLTPLTRTIHEHRGTIDKYMGDAIMAFWGAPLPDVEHRRHALEAAMEMQQRIQTIGDEFEQRGWPRLALGIGLNTGSMSVGNMGSEFRRAYTVLGDAVNTGSRLEGLTKAYGVQVICADSTRAGMDEWVFRELDKVRVKGKSEPVAIFEPLGPREGLAVELRKELAEYRKALMAYREQHWVEAEKAFHGLQARQPQRKLYGIYLERIRHFRAHPPGADWDGVFTHTDK